MSALAGLARHWQVFRAAWGEERARPPGPQRGRDELQFLPAALEVLETPPSPLGRAILWVIVAAAVATFAWSWLGWIDVIAVAEGRVVPSARTQVVQPLEAGTVREILVRDGTSVRQGDVLIRLDPTVATADVERLARDAMQSALESARLRAMLTRLPLDPDRPPPPAAFAPPAEADQAMLRVQRALMASLEAEHLARLAAQDQEILRQTAAQARSRSRIAQLEKAVPLVREREAARRTLYDKGLVPRPEFLALQQELVEKVGELASERHAQAEASAALGTAKRQREQADAEFERQRLSELHEAETRLSVARQELVKATQRREQQVLTAPMDGIVQQLAVHTLGGVVTPAQELLRIVPKDEQIEVEAMVQNKDIGFVREGQAAEVKVETFAFTRYGVIDALVTTVGRDAIIGGQNETYQIPRRAAQESRAAQGLVYPARVRLAKNHMLVEGRPVPLAAGMAVTVEIKTGKRRALEYFLSPIMQATQEAMRER